VLRLIRRIGKTFGPVVFVLSLMCLALVSSYKQAITDNQRSISSPDSISNSLARQDRRAIRISRDSAVNVMSVSDDGYVSSASGTYLSVSDKYYILTVSHAIVGDCQSIRIIHNGVMRECIEIKLNDEIIDYAIIEIERISNRTPVQLPVRNTRSSNWEQLLSIQRGIYYTGYPNGLGQLTIQGKIVGHDRGRNMFVHSFAWPGSSGSGVFSESGELIGVIVAISVGVTDFGIDVLEDMVIVIPLYKINWDMLQ
jgi:S1-C subfamily serine protease